MALFSGPDVEFHGKHYDLDGVIVEPHLDPLPPVWAAGGSQLAHEASPERPAMNPNVLRRIAAADGWIARPTCPPDLIAADRELIAAARAEAGRTGHRSPSPTRTSRGSRSGAPPTRSAPCSRRASATS